MAVQDPPNPGPCSHCGEDFEVHTDNCSSRNTECINTGCTRPRSNASEECFECRFSAYGTEWQIEQNERGYWP